jgi:hypothetical protein
MQLMEVDVRKSLIFLNLFCFLQATNQGVVGSIPASRTIKQSPEIARFQGFFLCVIKEPRVRLFDGICDEQGLYQRIR